MPASRPNGTVIPYHIAGLLAYLSQPDEKANEDQALSYFRKVFGDAFTRQKEAQGADGYVPGHFLLELKGTPADWLAGLCQALAYRNTELAFNQIIVAAKGFLAVWNVVDLPESLRDEILDASGAPSTIGKIFAQKYKHEKNRLLKLATWNGGFELSGGLFGSHASLVLAKIRSFEETLYRGRKTRVKITLRNFTAVLKEMTTFFELSQPIKAVRAFYSMCYAWNETSTLQLSQKADDQATLGGEVITSIRPTARERFKDFVENHAICLRPDENHDDFFARFDKALDAVDSGFRIKHGIFFTDLDLSRFVMWFVKRDIPQLGKDYLVIDPACGSGNLVTNWRSPLELRHKVVSEIEPELLFAVEKRMKGDQWHNGKFTVVPKVCENRGLNFIDRSASEYLNETRKYLQEKGLKPDKPIAFLCNPPYRSDEDQATGSVQYRPHSSILAITGQDGGHERYCCFLAQMKLICETAEASGLPSDSLLLLFTKSAWLTKREIFRRVRANIFSAFEDCGGMLVNGREFFDVKGSWPIAFTIWRYRGQNRSLNPERSISLVDLTWMTKADLSKISWDSSAGMERACKAIVDNSRSKTVEIGKDRISIREWSGQKMVDFKRSRRKEEIAQKVVGGLPADDRRQNNKKAYGETSGQFIGFMDDLTPCRVRKSIPGRPWFRLNNQFMDCKKNRCLSGPPTHWGYCASDLTSAKKLFFWYALARTFVQHPYPMWVDQDDMWEPPEPKAQTRDVLQIAFAIGYAENECLEARFPPNNPVQGLKELTVRNPMTSLDRDSFWMITLRPYCVASSNPNVTGLIALVDALYSEWQSLLRRRTELPIADKRYMIGDGCLTQGAGIIQIRDYAIDTANTSLLSAFREVQGALRLIKTEFFEIITSRNGLNYFAAEKTTLNRLPIMPPQRARVRKSVAKKSA